MIVGVPKELKANENRVALSLAGVGVLAEYGHTVLIECGAGEGSGFSDEDYQQAGAVMVESAAEVWKRAELIVKVKEPQPSEYQYFRDNLILFTYLHLAAEEQLTHHLLTHKVTALAYETVQENNSLPLLTPMSIIAGRMSVQIGAQMLEKPHGGAGILLSGVPGVPAANVTIIGGGVAGSQAARIAAGMGANVTIMDVNGRRLRELDDQFGPAVQTVMSNPLNIAEAVRASDLLIGAVLLPGKRAPKLITEEMVKSMKIGAVIVDIAVDQGGIFETVTQPTTHQNPTYQVHDVVHYAVANIPGAVPRTATQALTNATLEYILLIANKGLEAAVNTSSSLYSGLNTVNGCIVHEAVADTYGYQPKTYKQAVNSV